jgi:hypothetical protein
LDDRYGEYKGNEAMLAKSGRPRALTIHCQKDITTDIDEVIMTTHQSFPVNHQGLGTGIFSLLAEPCFLRETGPILRFFW